MIERIHITGSSGSGTTTLGRALAIQLKCQHFDTDSYYWIPTNPPFQINRELKDRHSHLTSALDSTDRWILSGSLCGWGDIFIPRFDLVVYLWIPKELRIQRLVEREIKRYGNKELEVGGKMYSIFNNFIHWASCYDDGGLNKRSKTMHEQWMASLNCKVLRLEGDMSVDERVEEVIATIRKN